MKLNSAYDQSPSDRGSGSTVLIVEDEQIFRNTLKHICSKLEVGKQVKLIETESVAEALKVLASTPIDVVLLDNNLPDPNQGARQSGIEAIPEFLDLQPNLQILVITSSTDTQDTVRAMKLGAKGYLPKDIDTQIKIAQINQAIQTSQIVMNQIMASRGQKPPKDSGLAGSSRAMQFVKDQARAFSQTILPILLTGSSGVGKSHLAQFIHNERSKYLRDEKRRFISVAINSFSSSVVERELFGHDKGAFTGANESKPGFFELANQGTLFLDEIGEASPELQAKLLKVLDGDGRFYRMGGTREHQSSFKLVCATNRDLKKCVADGSFREDLYMRISIFPIHVPDLSERSEDIPDIITQILPRICSKNEVKQVSIDEIPTPFIEHLMKHPPEGNIRGIEHLLSRLLVQVISPKDKTSSATLRSWRSITGIESNRTGSYRKVLTLDELMNLPLDVVGDGFPGTKAVLESIRERIYLDAESKYPKSTDIARVLGMAKSWVSEKRKTVKLSKYRNSESKGQVLKTDGSHKKSEALQ